MRCLGLLSSGFKSGGKRRQVACQVVELLQVVSIAADVNGHGGARALDCCGDRLAQPHLGK